MTVNLNISLFNYSDRSIFDIYMNKTDFMGAPAQGFYGSNGIMLEQVITLGPQVVSWRNAETGVTTKAKNTPILAEIPKGVKWLALHIYPDDTVELAFSKGTPDELSTIRGMKIIETWEKTHGK